MKPVRWFVFSDVHGPFEDPRKLNLVLDVAADVLNPTDVICINGDLLDFYQVNMHGPKHPDVQENLENEMFWGEEFIYNLRKRFPKNRIILKMGNHEHRLERFIIQYSKVFWNLLKIEKQLRLEQYDIEWTPYNERTRVEKTNLFIQHSPPSYAKNPAQTSLEKKIDGNYIWGCTHRPSTAYRTSCNSVTYEAHTLGWLGSTTLSKSHVQVFSYVKSHEDWGSSFAIVDVIGKEFFIHHCIIRDYKTSFGETWYEG